jgi:hypothetical protein
MVSLISQYKYTAADVSLSKAGLAKWLRRLIRITNSIITSSCRAQVRILQPAVLLSYYFTVLSEKYLSVSVSAFADLPSLG